MPTPHTYADDGLGDCADCPLPRAHPVHDTTPTPILPPIGSGRTETGSHHPVTSAEAALAALPRIGTRRRTILAVIAEPSGATDDEVEVATGLTHQSASACRRGLVIDGFVQPVYLDGDPVTRTTRTGNRATVWTLTPSGRALWQSGQRGVA